jgi:hypothetical protein
MKLTPDNIKQPILNENEAKKKNCFKANGHNCCANNCMAWIRLNDKIIIDEMPEEPTEGITHRTIRQRRYNGYYGDNSIIDTYRQNIEWEEHVDGDGNTYFSRPPSADIKDFNKIYGFCLALEEIMCNIQASMSEPKE